MTLQFCDPDMHDIVTPWLRAPTTLREWYPALSQTHCRKCGVTWPHAGIARKLGSAYWPAVPVADADDAPGGVRIEQ